MARISNRKSNAGKGAKSHNSGRFSRKTPLRGRQQADPSTGNSD
jgi:hypothetical protein